jgi:hypothetical protein
MNILTLMWTLTYANQVAYRQLSGSIFCIQRQKYLWLDVKISVSGFLSMASDTFWRPQFQQVNGERTTESPTSTRASFMESPSSTCQILRPPLSSKLSR